MARNFLLFLTIISLGYSYLEAAPDSDSSRIVGGQEATVGQFPYQVALYYFNSFGCGGSILNERYILTAAHCIEYLSPEYLKVRAGSISVSKGGQLHSIKRIIAHEDYKEYLNDIALLELEEPLEWSDVIKPIELQTEEVPQDEDVIISGWGRLNYPGELPDILQWVSVKSVTTQECVRSWPFANDSLICLKSPRNRGACKGDSGGPATYKGKLVGVCNFGEPCGHLPPDGYAKVPYFLDWIKKNMNA